MLQFGPLLELAVRHDLTKCMMLHSKQFPKAGFTKVEMAVGHPEEMIGLDEKVVVIDHAIRGRRQFLKP